MAHLVDQGLQHVILYFKLQDQNNDVSATTPGTHILTNYCISKEYMIPTITQTDIYLNINHNASIRTQKSADLTFE